ncbi:tetratricopeptide repeat protein [Sphingobacterium chungjuense]|uniref:tetratricopeptide repeat protein n=1 Tax=Sphingobacterium chungjuense TaxID=2675553 RepID=UPI00140C33D8|nr:tetratricopeptide repeat protein [Sphingobacterium chungjuense]
MRKVKIGMAALALALSVYSAEAQQAEHKNPNVRAGEKALMGGDFKTAITHLQKSMPAEAADADVHYLLGYALFQNGDFKKAADSFTKVVALNPKNTSAYYYKAKANNAVAVSTESKIDAKQRQALLESSIADYTKAISMDAQDAKLYQNRGTAYRDLGILKGNAGAGYNKAAATESYNKAVTDFEKVLTFDASRKDIQTELKKAKVYRDNLK